ncbi:4 [Durusdinium trenchii]|uniref:4 n=1 Tax=Durusdinium trenchii TaxID=1381693 RepID=A0ABP0RCC1_9DINO
MVGLHRGFVGQDDEHYTAAFTTMKPSEDFGGRLPDVARLNPSEKRVRQQEHLQDFLYELVEMPDIALAKSLHVDVNLWRRQQIHHATFLLKGSQERVWHVGKEIVQQLKGLSLKLNSGENLLQEFSCEVHVLRPGGGQHIALSIEKGERETRAGHTQWRGHGTAGGGVSNQIYFEVEINGKDVVFLRDMSFDLGRVKVTLQLLGCHTLTLRSRCLFDTHEYQLVVSNPRMTALTTPKAFDPEVVLRAVKVGAKRHANTVRPRPSQEDHNDSLEIKEHAAQKDVEGIGGKKMSMAKKVIHELMPRFTEKVIDLIEDRCFKFERQSKGLDEQLLQATREHEHEFIISVLRQAVSFVMLDVFLEKLEVDNADLLYIQHPNMVEVYEIIQEDSVDQDELDDVPGILKRRIDDGSDSEEGVRELMALEERQLLVQTWIMRLCHAIRTVAFLGIQKMDILSATDGVDDEQDEKQSDDLGLNEGGSAELTRWSSCRAVLNILQELLSRNEEIEEVWARFVASSSECIVNNPNGKLNLTFLTEKATFFCPFSYQQSQSAGSFSFTAAKLKNFFDEAQVPEVDPLMLVSILLYHPQALMRLEAFKLGCRILRDPNVVLQEAYKTHTSADMHLQKAIGFQFCVFEDLYKRDTYTENHIDMMAGMLKLIQQLCEGHLQPLQEFLGADYTVEELDIFSAKTLPGADEEDEHKVAQGRRQDQEEQKNEQPTNIVQWTSQMIHMILESMQEVTLNGREKQYVLVQQLFDTAAELIQGPSMENQATLLENGICADINLLWQNLRRDEGTFRGLIQDNEELFDTWMDLLRVMRSAEIAALKCAMSLLEELQLSEDDNDFAKQQEQVVLHKTTTLARMIQELAPKVLCWKIITHWNLSSEAADPQFEITPNDEDEVGESDKDENEETDEQIVRPKREKACLTYTLDEQYEDCLKVCGLCYSLFHAVFNAPETKTPLFRDVKIEQPVDRVAYTKQDWSVAKTKMFDQFLDKVQKMLGEKYLHFLFGQVEIVRGSRLQRIYFLVPKSIRVLKNHSLIHKWQEECLVAVERSSPEAQIDDFADMVNGQYISFVQKQYDLLGKPWPFNRAGEVIALCINSTMLTTAIINSILVLVYVGSYSEHSITAQDIHYPNHLSVYALTGFAAVHFSLSVLWLGFYILSYSGWIIETKVDEWREEHPQLQSQLNSTLFRLSLQAKIFFSDGQLMYTLFLLVFSFLGLFVSFLFNAVNTIDLCMRIPILAKVIESITVSRDQVAGTMVLGFCIQYMAVGAGFLLFSQGYGFADKDTSACSTLMECLRAHFDYGFRSAPVWSGPKLTYTRFTFDYVYNLVIILIMAAIISGIIIDTFADLREEQKTIQDKMKSSCFICSLSKSELERKRVKFENHILKDHYMWAYARFLLYLDETDPAELNGPESYVKQQIKENNTSFFPIARCISMESSDAGEEHLEREVRVKDLDEFKEKMNGMAADTEIMVQSERGMKADMKELRDAVAQQSQKVQALNQLLTSNDDDDKKKKKRKGG